MATSIDNLRTNSEIDPYFQLIQKFPLRHIYSDDELNEAIKIIDPLVKRGKLQAGEQDYLNVLADLVEKYEADSHPMTAVSDAEMLRYLIDAHGITQSNLAAAIKVSDSIVSEVLAGKRDLTRKQVGSVSNFFGVPASVFWFSGPTDH